MEKVIDFTKYTFVLDALKEWTAPSLCLHVAINIPPDLPNLPITDFDLNSNPQPSIDQEQDITLVPVKQELPSPSSATFASYRSNVRARRNPFQGLREGKQEIINPPFPWATDRRAMFYPTERLLANGITSIPGEVQCRLCDRRETMSLDLQLRFKEIENFLMQFIDWEKNRDMMKNRAPPEWLNPVFADCSSCKEPNCMKPLLPEKKREINWLFLFLSQTMGICSLKQLKWFCKHTHNHRTGAKDRVLYYSYISLGKQLDSSGIFQMFSTSPNTDVIIHEVN